LLKFSLRQLQHDQADDFFNPGPHDIAEILVRHAVTVVHHFFGSLAFALINRYHAGISPFHIFGDVEGQSQAHSHITGGLITGHRNYRGMPDRPISENSYIGCAAADIGQNHT